MPATEHLAELIGQKHQVLVQLREIGRRQADFVSSGEITSLLKLLAAKQHLIVALQKLESELRPFYGQDPDQRVWQSAADRTQCAQLASECNAMLEEIVTMEKQGAEQMSIRKNEVAEQLQQVHAATHVRNAYQAQRRNSA